MLRKSQVREDEAPEPEDDLLALEAERAFANAVIVEGMKRNPERLAEDRAALVKGHPELAVDGEAEEEAVTSRNEAADAED
jgi:hypothetical protein